jgi:tRNA threonylcarbamoyladenosine biosynthesis protein TsaB
MVYWFTATQELLKKENLTPKDISYTCISCGPGSFTGIRIAVTVAKTIAFANSSNIIAVNTLDVLAQNASDYMQAEKKEIGKIATILDAKRGQFFMAIYHFQDREWVKTTEDRLIDAPEFIRLYGGKEPIWLLGEGLVYYQKSFEAEGIHIIQKEYWQPMAEKVHRLGWKKILKKQFEDPMTLVPHYLRGHEAIPKAGLFMSQDQ